jgi:hypothetical protein
MDLFFSASLMPRSCRSHIVFGQNRLIFKTVNPARPADFLAASDRDGWSEVKVRRGDFLAVNRDGRQRVPPPGKVIFLAFLRDRKGDMIADTQENLVNPNRLMIGRLPGRIW